MELGLRVRAGLRRPTDLDSRVRHSGLFISLL
jgi:hypothetical protein